MPEYLAPGVYVEETSFRAKSIQGVGTSTTAYVGPTRAGPIKNGDTPIVPEVLTSFGEFQRIYGDSGDLGFGANYLAHSVRAYFDNGGTRLYVARTYTPTDPDNADSGKATATIFNVGGETAAFMARQPGSGLNGRVTLYEKRTPATQTQLRVAPNGSMAVQGGTSPARPASVRSEASQPFTLIAGDELVLTINGDAATTTFDADNAEATLDMSGAPGNVPPDTSLPVVIDGGPEQTILLDAGLFALDEIVNQINVQLRGGFARIEGTDIVIGSDTAGTNSSVTAGPLAALGVDDAVESAAVDADFADLSATTVAEIGAALQANDDIAADSLAVSADGDGRLVIATTATGAGATLAVGDTAMGARLGLQASPGADGQPRFYHRKVEGAWQAIAGNALDLANLPADLAIVQVNAEIEGSGGSRSLYENQGLYPDHPRYLGKTLPETTTVKSDLLNKPVFFVATEGVAGDAVHAQLFALGDERSFSLSGGTDGLPPIANDQDQNTQSVADALTVLEDIDDIAIVAAPGHSTLQNGNFPAVQDLLIGHAERMRYRFAVLDTPPGQLTGEARVSRSRIDSYRAALYYPWIVVANPAARPGDEGIPKEILLPPSGFVTGIYARNDVSRGVWKAPANEIVRGALRFEREINKGQQEVLNPEGVNCLRFFFGRGNRIWGARTASSDPEWMYVNVVRYFIYLEHSIDRSTQWAVFEPNGERLWSNITDTVSAFLFNEWRSGALLGSTPDQAYFVRCDRSTMTQADLDNGRLICEIGVAALKPAEFVIFRIGQKTADA